MNKEELFRKKLEYLLESNPITQDIANDWLKQIKEEAGDESQNKWTILKDSNDKKNDDSSLLP